MTAPVTGYVNKEAASRSGEEIGVSFGNNLPAYAE